MPNSAVHYSCIATLDIAVNAWRTLKDLYGREKGIHVGTVQLVEETARFPPMRDVEPEATAAAVYVCWEQTAAFGII